MGFGLFFSPMTIFIQTICMSSVSTLTESSSLQNYKLGELRQKLAEQYGMTHYGMINPLLNLVDTTYSNTNEPIESRYRRGLAEVSHDINTLISEKAKAEATGLDSSEIYLTYDPQSQNYKLVSANGFNLTESMQKSIGPSANGVPQFEQDRNLLDLVNSEKMIAEFINIDGETSFVEMSPNHNSAEAIARGHWGASHARIHSYAPFEVEDQYIIPTSSGEVTALGKISTKFIWFSASAEHMLENSEDFMLDPYQESKSEADCNGRSDLVVMSKARAFSRQEVNQLEKNLENYQLGNATPDQIEKIMLVKDKNLKEILDNLIWHLPFSKFEADLQTMMQIGSNNNAIIQTLAEIASEYNSIFNRQVEDILQDIDPDSDSSLTQTFLTYIKDMGSAQKYALTTREAIIGCGIKSEQKPGDISTGILGSGGSQWTNVGSSQNILDFIYGFDKYGSRRLQCPNCMHTIQRGFEQLVPACGACNVALSC